MGAAKGFIPSVGYFMLWYMFKATRKELQLCKGFVLTTRVLYLTLSVWIKAKDWDRIQLPTSDFTLTTQAASSIFKSTNKCCHTQCGSAECSRRITQATHHPPSYHMQCSVEWKKRHSAALCFNIIWTKDRKRVCVRQRDTDCCGPNSSFNKSTW